MSITYIKASNSDIGDEFGASISIDGDVMVVGARNESSSSSGINGDEGNNDLKNSGAAYVYRYNSSGGVWVKEAYLKASNPGEWNTFGTSVSVSGDIIVVGSPQEDVNSTGINGTQGNTGAPNSGSVYVFRYNSGGGVWEQEAYIKASNTSSQSMFGSSVSVDGDVIVVGARYENSNSSGNQFNDKALNSGAAYVFRYNSGGGVWEQEAYLKASNVSSDDNFGFSVDVSGDVIVVGAYLEDSGATGVNGTSNIKAHNSGAAYVFRYNSGGGVWEQEAYLKASNTDKNDYFGVSVGVYGDVIAVGAPLESSSSSGINGNPTDNTLRHSGAVYVYRYNSGGGVWEQEAYLKASNPDKGDTFGDKVSVYGDRVVVSAIGEMSSSSGVNSDQSDNTNNENAGAVYVFKYDSGGGMWQQEGYIKATNAPLSGFFGESVGVSNNKIIVGAPSENSSANTINGDQLNIDKRFSGAVYVYDSSLLNETPPVSTYIKASNTNSNDYFGFKVSSTSNLIVVGAPFESSDGVEGNNNSLNSGAVYVYRYNGGAGEWSQEGYLKASNLESNDYFGISVAVSRRQIIVVGAPLEDCSSKGVNGYQLNNNALTSGAVYVYRYSNSETKWQQEAYLKASNTKAEHRFGTSVAINDDGNLIVVGAPSENSNATGVGGDEGNTSAPNSGAVYVFKYNGSSWEQVGYIKANNTGIYDRFGAAVSVQADTIAVGAPNETSGATGIDSNWTDNSTVDAGAVYIFREGGVNGWTQEAYVKASNTGSNHRFGTSVVLNTSGSLVVVGSPGENNTGGVYVFEETGSGWGQIGILHSDNAESGDSFGSSVDISSNLNILVGAPLESSNATGVNGDGGNNSATNSGAVYLFEYDSNGNSWNQTKYLKASNTDSNDNFGSSVSISGSTITIGAPYEGSNSMGVGGDEGNNSAPNSGAVYVF